MVRLETTIRRYVGLAGDRKPLPGVAQLDGATPAVSDLPTGSTFRELDTGAEWRFDGTNWVPVAKSEDLQLRTLQAIWRELRLLRALQERDLDLEGEDLVAADDLIQP